jgi:hypothetical protein
MQSARAVSFVRAISTIFDAVAQSHFLDALVVGATEVHIMVEVVWANGALRHVSGDEMVFIFIAARLIGPISAVIGTVAAAGLGNAGAIKAAECV